MCYEIYMQWEFLWTFERMTWLKTCSHICLHIWVLLVYLLVYLISGTPSSELTSSMISQMAESIIVKYLKSQIEMPLLGSSAITVDSRWSAQGLSIAGPEQGHRGQRAFVHISYEANRPIQELMGLSLFWLCRNRRQSGIWGATSMTIIWGARFHPWRESPPKARVVWDADDFLNASSV